MQRLIPPDMKSVRRVLIVKLSAIGDVVHALPVSAALGEAFPHLELTWIVEERAAPMLVGNPYLKEVIVAPAHMKLNRLSAASVRGFLQLRRDLRSRAFDLAIDLQGLSKSALIAWASGAPRRFGYDWLRELAPLLETRVPRRPQSVHVVDQYLDVARFLGAAVHRVQFPLPITPEEEQQAADLLRGSGVGPGTPFLAVNPSSGGGGHKGWGAERIIALLNELGSRPLAVVLVGGPEDRAVADYILRRASCPPADLVGRTTLRQLAALLHQASAHLSGDTGSAHIAAALGTPVVSIFGRTNPARLAPYGQEDRALHHRDRCEAACRRFHERAPVNSRQKCLAPPPRCIESVTVEEVSSMVRRVLSESSAAKPGRPAESHA